jgi:hypothetical protein
MDTCGENDTPCIRSCNKAFRQCKAGCNAKFEAVLSKIAADYDSEVMEMAKKRVTKTAKAAKTTTRTAKKTPAAKAKKKANMYRAIVRTLCKDGTITTRHDTAMNCKDAYENAEKVNVGFCRVHGGVQKHTRVSCTAE